MTHAALPSSGVSLRAAIAAAFMLLLAACAGSGGQSKFADVNAGPKGKPVPPVALIQVEGLSQAKRQIVSEALAIEAGKHDIGIVEGALDGGGFTLSGQFRLIQDGARATLTATWQMQDQSGAVIDTVTKDEVGLIAGAGEPWSAVSDAMLRRIAAYTAKSLAGRLASLGYATVVEAPMSAAADPINTGTITPKAKPPKPAADGAPAIKAVAVLPVTGIGGKAPGELTAAMRSALKKAGWPVLSQPRKDAITVAGRITAGDASGGNQPVKLSWTVKAPDGRVLGTIKQSNDLPEGTLEDAWGDNARYAAEGAASGIFELIDKLR